MCGIIGILGRSPVQGRLVESLKRLEYRGYDSAGIAGHVDGGGIQRRRAAGKLRNLEAVLEAEPLNAVVGIGHTRWATHGAPNEGNAHPHTAGRVTLVHNGIIENFAELREELLAKGRKFVSETDTEVVAHLLDENLRTLPPVDAMKATLDRLTGAYALVALIEGEPDLMLGARHGPPLVVGYGRGEMYLGSDALAVGSINSRVANLEDWDFVTLTHDGTQIFDASGAAVVRKAQNVAASVALMEKGNYRHFMEKEIHDQPEACQHTLSAYVDAVTDATRTPGAIDLPAVERLQIVACGSAAYSGRLGRRLVEKLARLPTDVEAASEFRYREPALTQGTV